ncbi:ccaat transcription factor [Anaeramoeba flamelloides]|uniref:Ccaat transcription factor n=1 Tax=Anaeramoeba flamelloides TaxID=1746091 RepID=A0AAV7YX38_9EUKA|nr:ccaat transcription factor [Anaeramoeba flamelloides]
MSKKKEPELTIRQLALQRLSSKLVGEFGNSNKQDTNRNKFGSNTNFQFHQKRKNTARTFNEQIFTPQISKTNNNKSKNNDNNRGRGRGMARGRGRGRGRRRGRERGRGRGRGRGRENIRRTVSWVAEKPSVLTKSDLFGITDKDPTESNKKQSVSITEQVRRSILQSIFQKPIQKTENKQTKKIETNTNKKNQTLPQESNNTPKNNITNKRTKPELKSY